jgi:hypothetical protein
VNGEITHINSPQGKIDLEFAKNVKKQSNFNLFKTL